jgi:hypothetical protein
LSLSEKSAESEESLGNDMLSSQNSLLSQPDALDAAIPQSSPITKSLGISPELPLAPAE